jgi:hypothetical protein
MLIKNEKDLFVTSPNGIRIANHSLTLTKVELSNISNTIKYLIENIDYKTPSDRNLSFMVDTQIYPNLRMDLMVNITPCVRGKVKKKVETLGKHITITLRCDVNSDDLIEGGIFQKQILWILEYFGLTIMYTKKYTQIKIDYNNTFSPRVTFI